MSAVFLKVVNMSISAGWTVLAVLLLRFLLGRAPKRITVLLWGIVAVRLICPFSVESAMSLLPGTETVSPTIMTDSTPEIDSGIPVINSVVNPVIGAVFAPDPVSSANPLQVWVPVMSVVWIVGAAAMLLYTVVGYFRVKRRVGTAVLLGDNIFQSESVVSPFVFGVVKPRIYLPFDIGDRDTEYVLAHERAHIRRRDHWWKPFGFILLSLHWFNPLIWLGYVMLCRDIESACDEEVVRQMTVEERADYSQALLNCSVNRRAVSSCPIAFGEVGVKNRVKAVLNYRKPTFWTAAVAVILCIVAAICFLTGHQTRQTKISAELSAFLDGQIVENHKSDQTNGNFVAIDYRILDVDKSSNEVTVYMWVLYKEYSMKDGKISMESGAHTPTVVTARRTDSIGHGEEHYELAEYWIPRDGSYYAGDIKAKFPKRLQNDAFDSQKYIDEQDASCDKSAEEYFGAVM